MRPGLWWWHCCRAQRLLGVQRLSRSTDGLYSHPTPNLSWDQAFLFNKALSISKLSSLNFFFFLLLLFLQKKKKHSWLLRSLKETKLWVQLYFLLLSSDDKSTAHVCVLWPKSISHHDGQLVHILSVWLWVDFSFWAEEINAKHEYDLR